MKVHCPDCGGDGYTFKDYTDPRTKINCLKCGGTGERKVPDNKKKSLGKKESKISSLYSRGEIVYSEH